MRIDRRSVLASAALALLGVAGCGGPDNVKLQEAPPVAIAPPKEAPVTKDRASLKAGAPAKGSSGGIKFNPNEMPPAR